MYAYIKRKAESQKIPQLTYFDNDGKIAELTVITVCDFNEVTRCLTYK